MVARSSFTFTGMAGVTRALGLTLLVFAMAIPLFAALTGDLQGTVLDSSGAVVVDAKVVVKDLGTGVTRTLTTNQQGQFAALQLALGLYEVTLEKSGFRGFATKVDIRSGEITRLPVTLEVGAPDELITVESETTPLLDVATSQVSTSLEYQTVVQLPIQNRDPVQFATLAPGVVPVTNDNPFLGSGSFNSNGSRGRGNNITVDGVTSTDISTTGASGTGTFSLDQVQEFKLITNNYSAELGRNSGSQVQIITKGGTNDLHGTAYWFHQNKALNARDYFDDTGEATPLIQNLWGFTFGGPLLKDRTFFFGHYEGLKIRGAGSTVVANVLTPAEAAAITDPTSLALFNAVGAPTDPSGDLSSSAPNANDQYSWSLRIDQVWRDGKDVLNVRYGANPTSAVDPGLTFIGTNLPNFGASVVSTARTVTVAHTHVFNPRVVNQFRFAYGRSNPGFAPFTDLPEPFAPRIAITGFDAFGVSNILPQGRVQNTFQWSDSVSWSSGRHSLKVGGDIFYYQANSVFDANFRGTVTFADLAAFQAGTPTSFTQNFGTSARHNVSKDFAWFGQDDIRVTPSFTLNLGLRLERSGGVEERDDILANLDRNRFDAIGAAGVGPLGSIDLGGFAFSSNLNWAPRVGFSWNVLDGKMVVRGGIGWAYDYIFLNPITNLRFSAPFVPSIDQRTFTGSNTLANLAAGTAQAQTDAQAAVGVFSPTQFNFGGLAPVQQDLQNPRNTQWNFGIQYELVRNTVLKLSYVGSKNDFLQASVPINLVRPANVPAPATSEADEIARAAAFRAAFIAQSGNASGTVVNNRVDPRFNAVNQVQSRGGSNYNSLQIDLTRRFGSGLNFGVNYTWAHSIDDVSDVLGVLVNDSPAFQDPRNLSGNRANSQFDIRHRFVGHYLWEIPWSKNLTGAKGKVLGGWSVSGIVGHRTALPVTIFAGTRRSVNNNSLLGGGIVQADGDVSLFRPVVPGTAAADAIPGAVVPVGSTLAAELCLRGVVTSGTASCPNTSNFPFTQPLLGNFGNSGRNRLRLDKLFNTDFAILKDTLITERVKLQFRWEIYNLFNTPNFNDFVNNLSRSDFGRYRNTETDTRQMQGSLKVIF